MYQRAINKQYSDAEKANYYKKKFAAVASGAAAAALAKKKPVRKNVSTAVETLPGTTTPTAPVYKQVRSKRSIPTRDDGYSAPRGYDPKYKKPAVRTAQVPRKSKMESISHLIEAQGFDKDKFSEEMDKKLKQSSIYFQSLVDPLQGAGAKIPDLTTVPTGTFQMVQRVQVTANPQGVAAIRIPSPQFASANITTLTSQFAGYQVSNVGSAPGALTWGAITNWDGYTALSSSVAYSRCVSAALYAEYLGTELQDSGQFSMQFAPGTFSSPTSVTQLQNFPYSSIVPVNRNSPVMVRYLPQGFYDVPFIQGGAGVGSDFGPHTDSMIIVCNDIPASASNVLFTFVANYEFQPSSATANIIDTYPSPSDPIEMSKVSQWSQEIETAGLVQAQYVDVVPSAVASNRAEAKLTQYEDKESLGGLGMLGEILDFAIPTLMKVVPMLL